MWWASSWLHARHAGPGLAGHGSGGIVGVLAACTTCGAWASRAWVWWPGTHGSVLQICCNPSTPVVLPLLGPTTRCQHSPQVPKAVTCLSTCIQGSQPRAAPARIFCTTPVHMPAVRCAVCTLPPPLGRLPAPCGTCSCSPVHTCGLSPCGHMLTCTRDLKAGATQLGSERQRTTSDCTWPHGAARGTWGSTGDVGACAHLQAA
jgi:hypothetical protein